MLAAMKTVLTVACFVSLTWAACGCNGPQRNNMVYLEALGNCSNITNLINISSLNVSNLNGSTVALKGSVTLNGDIPVDNMVNLKAFGMLNKKWLPLGVTTADVNGCSFLANDTQYYPPLQSLTELPPKCPFKKGEYKIRPNATLDLSKLPMFLPFGCWRIEITLKNSTGQILSCVQAITKITPPHGRPNPKCV